jgi:3'-phosphoadenosine 5'-phosphosulfate sulfotransferase (PAPS reductase)/FAD synthetase
MKAKGLSLVVSCMGIRAQESSARSKAVPFKLNKRNSKAGREWYDMMPIHNWSIDEVFATVADAGEELHWAYSKGMSRLSCCFCIMSSKKDLKIAAGLVPQLFEKLKAVEKKIGQTFLMPSKKHGRQFLGDVVSCF